MGKPTSLLYYNEYTITNWTLIDDSKVINTFNCKKAKVNYKGRNWVAWYTTDVPLSYGPYKFTGLPGLIVKITDENLDYDFEIVNSIATEKLKDMVLTVNKRRYENGSETTFSGIQVAKKNFNDNLIGTLESMGTSIAPEQKENIRNMQIQKQKDMNDQNSIEQIK